MIALATALLALAPQQEAQPGPLTVALHEDVSLTLHWIPPGSFAMGSALDAEAAAERYGGSARFAQGEHPPREVRIERGFHLGRTEVTVGQFEVFVRSTDHRTTAERQGFGFRSAPGGGWDRVEGLSWQEPGWEVDAEQAVSYVTHEDATAFCRWLSGVTGRTFRLPLGSEWEYACGGGGASFAVGDSVQELRRVAWFGRTGWPNGPSRVATLEPGPNGLFDMHGNVWEWCSDVVPDDPGSKLLKGGSFLNGPFKLRAAYRPFDDGSLAEPHLGFRVLAEAPEAPSKPAAEEREEPDRSGLEAFRYDPALADVGRVLHYRHSNIDGSRASRVSLYWAAADRLESLKWNPGWTRSTLVLAEMDWETFSVDGFETFEVTSGGARSRQARLETRDGELIVAGGALRCDVESLPWHSYDFDLASLNLSLRFRVDSAAPLTFAVADAIRGPGGVTFGFKGEVEMLYLADEERAGVACRKYSLEGPGLELRGGHLWAAKGGRAHFVDFEIDLPDEPGMTSGKLTLLESAELTPEQWQAFVEASVE